MQCKITAKNGSLYLSTGKADSFIIRCGSDRYSIIMGTNNQQNMQLTKQQARSLCLNLLQMFPDIPQAIKTTDILQQQGGTADATSTAME